MHNKSLLITLGVFILVIVSGLGFFYVASSRKPVQQVKQVPVINDKQVPTLSAEAIGFTMALAETGEHAGHAVEIQVTRLDGISSIEYEFSYLYEDDLNQGGFGNFDIKPGDAMVSQKIILGTCSSGHCRYDKNVSHFTVNLLVTKTDGKVYKVQKEMALYTPLK